MNLDKITHLVSEKLITLTNYGFRYNIEMSENQAEAYFTSTPEWRYGTGIGVKSSIKYPEVNFGIKITGDVSEETVSEYLASNIFSSVVGGEK